MIRTESRLWRRVAEEVAAGGYVGQRDPNRWAALCLVILSMRKDGLIEEELREAAELRIKEHMRLPGGRHAQTLFAFPLDEEGNAARVLAALFLGLEAEEEAATESYNEYYLRTEGAV